MDAEQPPAQAVALDAQQQQLAEFQAAMAQLQQQVQAMQADRAAMQAERAAMQQNLQQAQHLAYAAIQANQAAPAPPPQRSPITEALLRLPAQQFNGERGSSRYLREWVADLEQRFSVMRPAPTDGEKIAYAAGLLVLKARVWYQTQRHLLLTWPDFTAALVRHYAPLNQQDHAVDRLQTLKQTSSVGAYAATFNDLVIQLPGIPDHILTRLFVNGLKPRIRGMVKAQSAGLNLEELQALADQLEDVHLEEQQLNRHFNANNSVRPPMPRHHNPNALQQREGPAPMELGARQLHRQHRLAPPSRRFVRVTPNTRRVLSSTPFCPHCRRPGHSVDQCPARSARPAARPPYQGNGQRRRQ
jgi:hypothetical protein